MVEKFLQEIRTNFSDEELLDLCCGILEPSKLDSLQELAGKLSEAEADEAERRFGKILLDIPDQVKIDYIEKHPDADVYLIPYIRDTDKKMSFFDDTKLKYGHYKSAFGEAIELIEDDEQRYSYLINYCNKLYGSAIINVFKSFADEKYIIDFLDNHKKLTIYTSPYTLCGIIDLLKDDRVKAHYIISYAGLLDGQTLYTLLSNIKEKKLIDDILGNILDSSAFERLLTGHTNKEFKKAIKELTENTDLKLKIFKKELEIWGEPVIRRLRDTMNNDEEKLDELFKKMMLMFDESEIQQLLNYYIARGCRNDLEINIFNSMDSFNASLDLFYKLTHSNSSELTRIAIDSRATSDLFTMIMSYPYEQWDSLLNKIEEVFIKNNIPYVGKIFKVFEILNPGDYVLDTQSPNINALHDREDSISKKIGLRALIFSDLLKCAIGSNNKSLIEYINNIELGNKILIDMVRGEINVNELSDEQKEIFTIYIMHLNALYNNTEEGKKNPRKLQESLVKDAYELLSRFLVNERKKFRVVDLPDRIVKMFGHFAGIDTIEQLKEMMTKEIKEADARNRKRAEENNFSLEKGDFYKGLANENLDEKDRFYTFFINILQNGSISKEFLGSDARSDTTPLDTDLSRIEEDITSFSEPFVDHRYAASRYGPLWLVLKDDERMNYSRESNKYIPGKLEVFRTGLDGMSHYGIRTGFPSSQIDYFVVDDSIINLNRIYNSIVMNGFYIPVLNTEGKLIFTPCMFDEMQKNLDGLSYYGRGSEYEFATELDSFDSSSEIYPIDIDSNIDECRIKRNLVINALSRTGLNIKTKRNVYMSTGEVELLDIGSTGRGTNTKDDYDFDFIMRIDKEVYNNDEKLEEFKDKIREAFPGIEFEGRAKIREQIINIDGQDIKIDISIIIKDDKIGYTTEECIKDRLSSIEKIDPEKHKKVIENIVLAKEVLKKGKCYKPRQASNGHAEGGLGGAGVENWILQHGGSFEAAARSFMEVANQSGTFESFANKYHVFNYGENHMYYRHSDQFKHNDFIADSMDEEGYERMKETLKKYLMQLDERRSLSDGSKTL